ncbi:MAG: DNA primase [Alphaproteobacteria bacterium]|nr:DNA primase [Alphaproteobacteria bacterium]
MQIPRDIIDEVRNRTDIVEVIGQFVTLRSKGNSHQGLCPFHQEKTPSFNVLRNKQIFHCFGCKEGGDVFSFLMKIKGLSFVEAVKELAGPAGITIEERELSPQERANVRRRASLHDACEAAAEFFHATLLTKPVAAGAREYLKGRGIELEAVKRFRLGFAPEGWTHLLDHLHGEGIAPELAVRAGLAKRNERRGSTYDVFRDRIIIPITDHRDRPIAFGGRLMSGEGPKYINSPETEIYEKSKTLYGLSQARPAIQRRDRALVVEGYFDVISLAVAGFPEAVATCGTALTPDHLEQLRRLTGTVIALFDGDEAGQRAADRALPIFLDKGMEARHLALPDKLDPDEFVRERGVEAFEALLDDSRPLVEIVVSRAARRHGTTPGGRQRAVEEVMPMLRKMPDVMQSDMLRQVANLLGVREAVLRERFGRPERPPPPMHPEGGGGARWVGNVELNRLLWLLIHLPAETVPLMSQVSDPTIVTDRPDVAKTILRLMEGKPLPTVLDETEDPDLQRVLRHVAAQEGFCAPEQAGPMTRQVLARLERRAIEGQLSDLRRRISDQGQSSDPGRLRALLSRKVELQRRLHELMPLVSASV